MILMRYGEREYASGRECRRSMNGLTQRQKKVPLLSGAPWECCFNGIRLMRALLCVIEQDCRAPAWQGYDGADDGVSGDAAFHDAGER